MPDDTTWIVSKEQKEEADRRTAEFNDLTNAIFADLADQERSKKAVEAVNEYTRSLVQQEDPERVSGVGREVGQPGPDK